MVDSNKYPKLSLLEGYLDDLNTLLARTLSYSFTFNYLNDKLAKSDDKTLNEKVLNKYNPLFNFMYFGMRDLAFLELHHIFDKKSKGTTIFKVVSFLKNNYKDLNIESKMLFVDRDFFEKFEEIKYEDIILLETDIESNEVLISKVKTFRDKRVAHNESIHDTGFKMLKFEELRNIILFFTTKVNDIDLQFFSNQTDRSFLREQIQRSIDLLFTDLIKQLGKK